MKRGPHPIGIALAAVFIGVIVTPFVFHNDKPQGGRMDDKTTITVYGASDDLIELEGGISEVPAGDPEGPDYSDRVTLIVPNRPGGPRMWAVHGDAIARPKR